MYIRRFAPADADAVVRVSELATRITSGAVYDAAFVEEMVAMKLKAGQFDNAEISIHELEVVKEGLKSYLSQLYHERIVYPGQKQ